MTKYLVDPKLPSRGSTQAIRELYKQGWTRSRILHHGGTGLQSRTIHKLCDDIDSGAHRYDTEDDEVAIARALAGDRVVFEGLTHYERKEVLISVGCRRTREVEQNRTELAYLNRLKIHGSSGRALHRFEWFDALAEQWGIEAVKLNNASRNLYVHWMAGAQVA